MTKKELQAQINFLISELQRLRNGHNKLSDEAFNDRINKNKFYGMWRKADEKAERYGGLLFAIKDILNQESVDEDDAVYRLDGITQLIDDWYEQEMIQLKREIKFKAWNRRRNDHQKTKRARAKRKNRENL